VSVVRFTKNYRDRSTDSGYQFEFFCDRGYGSWFPNWLSYHFPEACSYSYVSSLQSFPLGVANKVKEATSWLSARFPQISPAGDAVNNIHKEAWESAFANAVLEAKRHFRECTSCNKWVCVHSCFNQTTGTCKTCSALGILSRPKPNNGAENSFVVCKQCGSTSEPGKFCDTCGKSMTLEIFCGNCGKKIEADRRFKFCPHCGDSLSYVDEIVDPGQPA
jgi:hypothetical protein